MTFSKIFLDPEIKKDLENFERRTGLSKNILSRFALMLSLKEDQTPDYGRFKTVGGFEITKTTLTGDYDSYIMSLVRMHAQNLSLSTSVEDIKNLTTYLINNGVLKLKSILNKSGKKDDESELNNDTLAKLVNYSLIVYKKETKINDKIEFM